MAYEVLKLDSHKRAVAKQASRGEDSRRVASGEISDRDLKRENSFFGSLDKSKFKMVAIGGKPLARKM
ncbi:hypothetical protein [Rhizobium sp.]|uniref:hypothetical protein n=1 Tax=Rhizobium sp. TaxID=391 RepID=UPI0028AB8AEF